LTKHLDEFKIRDHGQCSQNGEVILCFVDATVSGVKLESLVDIEVNHNFISGRTAKSLHCKLEGSMFAFKVVKSMVHLVTRVVRSAPLRVKS